MAIHSTCSTCGLPCISYYDDETGDVWVHDATFDDDVTVAELAAANRDHVPVPV